MKDITITAHFETQEELQGFLVNSSGDDVEQLKTDIEEMEISAKSQVEEITRLNALKVKLESTIGNLNVASQRLQESNAALIKENEELKTENSSLIAVNNPDITGLKNEAKLAGRKEVIDFMNAHWGMNEGVPNWAKITEAFLTDKLVTEIDALTKLKNN
jgi:hypothetical protein